MSYMSLNWGLCPLWIWLNRSWWHLWEPFYLMCVHSPCLFCIHIWRKSLLLPCTVWGIHTTSIKAALIVAYGWAKNKWALAIQDVWMSSYQALQAFLVVVGIRSKLVSEEYWNRSSYKRKDESGNVTVQFQPTSSGTSPMTTSHVLQCLWLLSSLILNSQFILNCL